MKITQKYPLSLAEIKELLKKRGKGGKEGKEKKAKEEKAEKVEEAEEAVEENRRAEQTLEYASKFAKLNFDEAKKLREELKALQLAKLDDEHIVKIVDIVPRDADELRKIFVGSISPDQNEMQKILEIVAKYKK
ncbi:MAG: DNA-directed RNA polymerase subunit F [Candidatus Pacearchaeota archaeon]